MALDQTVLKNMIIAEMQGLGFVTSGTYAWADRLAEAIANAVVDHITSDAEVIIPGGSSAGTYPVT